MAILEGSIAKFIALKKELKELQMTEKHHDIKLTHSHVSFEKIIVLRETIKNNEMDINHSEKLLESLNNAYSESSSFISHL